jgi:hypothetical protein
MVDDREHPAKEEQVARLYRLDVRCQTASGEMGAECQDPAAGDLHRQAANLYRLPSSRVRTAVHVQHLPGYVTSFRQINDSFSNVLRLGDRAHR